MIKINKREKILIYVIAALLFCFLVERFLFSGLRGRARALSKEIKVEEAALKNGLDLQKRKDSISAEYKDLKPYLEKVEGISEREMFAKFLKESEKIAQEAGVSIVSLSPNNEPEDMVTYVKYEAQLRAEGNLQQAINFLYKVQTNTLLIKFDKLSLSTKDEGGASIKIEAAISLAAPKS